MDPDPLFPSALIRSFDGKMKLIWRYVRPYRWFILAVMAIKLAGTGTELLIPYVLEHLLDHVVPAAADAWPVVAWGGVMLLLLKPIKVDEYIKVGDVEGTVKRIGAFYTELATPDNRYITMPNSSLTNTAIYNNARLGTRRLDVFFSVSYDADIDHVKQVLTEVIGRCEGILPDPAPAVKLTECGDSAMRYVIRVWTNGSDYWNANFFLLEEGKKALDAAGIPIPYPQMDVHLKQN